MREIKFRGKSKNYNEWVYGYIFKTTNNDDYFIKMITKSSDKLYWIQEETIGQYTRTT